MTLPSRCASSDRQAQRISEDAHLVLLEIGGNDLFAPTPPEQFRKDLTHLLGQVVHPNRTVILLELPVLPWDVQYTRIQRQAAKSYGVTIVPKRFFASVIGRPGSTIDLAHLSALGHERMADQVAHLLGLTKVSK
jgi:lysophospholipase L1-like esterase